MLISMYTASHFKHRSEQELRTAQVNPSAATGRKVLMRSRGITTKVVQIVDCRRQPSAGGGDAVGVRVPAFIVSPWVQRGASVPSMGARRQRE
jgi:hypothetical protein